jgi:two-component system response regulator QseB
MALERTAVVIEDDADVRNLLTAILNEAGFACIPAENGVEGINAVREHRPILTTRDVSLPGIDGFEVARRIRGFSNTYVIMLSARNEEIDTLMGLDAGADDYLTKPFSLDELAARMRALLRRDIAREGNVLRHRELTLDTATREVTQSGRPVDVSAREFALLAALLERPGAALSKAQLEERIYRWGDEVESNAVEVHIHNLRKKLGSETIRTLRGVGYALA